MPRSSRPVLSNVRSMVFGVLIRIESESVSMPGEPVVVGFGDRVTVDRPDQLEGFWGLGHAVDGTVGHHLRARPGPLELEHFAEASRLIFLSGWRRCGLGLRRPRLRRARGRQHQAEAASESCDQSASTPAAVFQR